MIPKTFSATSLQVADQCLARYKAEFIDKGANFQGSAANVGIVCHNTLEEFLRAVYIRKDAKWEEEVFWHFFHEAYGITFGPDRTLPEYEDAHTLCYNWFHRDKQESMFAARKILSLESKNNFPMKTSVGEIPTTYIMDRLDKLGPTEYEVVDYKTNRIALTPDQLRRKIQARLYALAVQIVYKDATSIWVTFDFLRHKPVSVEFKRQDQVDTFRMLQRATQRIIDTDENNPPETLNSDCGWCIRKASCKAIQSNIAAGGIMTQDLDALAKLYVQVTNLANAQSQLAADIENMLLAEAIQRDTLELELDSARVFVTAKKARKPNHRAIAAVLGQGLALEVASFRVAQIDQLIKTGAVDEVQAKLLKECMPIEIGEPSVKVEPKELI